MATSSERPTRKQAQRRGVTEVQEWAQTLSQEQLLCRDLGHQWTPYRAWHDKANREYVQVLACSRGCGAQRNRRLDYRGQRVGQHYSYDDNYLAPKGSGALSADGRADLRLVSLMRLIDESAEEPVDLATRRNSKAS